MDEKKIRKLFSKSSQTTRNKGWVDEEINFDDQVFSYATLSTFFFMKKEVIHGAVNIITKIRTHFITIWILLNIEFGSMLSVVAISKFIRSQQLR